jgi:hypothetical protein
MSDIVERLRSHPGVLMATVRTEAADEIDRLRAELTEAKLVDIRLGKHVDSVHQGIMKLGAEVAGLKKELAEAKAAAINQVAAWAQSLGMSTGHAETMEDLLAELTANWEEAKAACDERVVRAFLWGWFDGSDPHDFDQQDQSNAEQEARRRIEAGEL